VGRGEGFLFPDVSGPATETGGNSQAAARKGIVNKVKPTVVASNSNFSERP
jgi:hypothetical protein